MKNAKRGDLLKEVQSGVIVHGCNAQGVMGGGFALQVKERYPKAFSEYVKFCDNHKGPLLGSVQFIQVTDSLVIANAITQDLYGTNKRQVDYEAVARCFEVIKMAHSDSNIHYPMIGAGLGGGKWTIIYAIINETLKDCNHTLWIYK